MTDGETMIPISGWIIPSIESINKLQLSPARLYNSIDNTAAIVDNKEIRIILFYCHVLTKCTSCVVSFLLFRICLIASR